ncbi:MAG: cytochrome c oxidase subunit II transmembrane domain-containing protein, partial [Pseudomonadota bacterium]
MTKRAVLGAKLAAWTAGLWALAVGGAGAQQPTPWQIDLQPAATPLMEQVRDFHTLLLVIITAIVLVVLGLLVWVLFKFNAKANPTPKNFSHNTLVEVVWTVVPIIILLVIAVPSFRLLYNTDRVPEADMTVKAI